MTLHLKAIISISGEFEGDIFAGETEESLRLGLISGEIQMHPEFLSVMGQGRMRIRLTRNGKPVAHLACYGSPIHSGTLGLA